MVEHHRSHVLNRCVLILFTGHIEDDTITDRKERAQLFGQYDHVRVYGRDYFDKLRTIGFRVDEVDYTQTMSSDVVTKYCLSKGEILPVCYK